LTILIHDRENIKNENIFIDSTEEATIISDNGKISPCICCFGCWIKKPGQCVINDGYENMGAVLSKCEKLIIVSQCFYGGFRPFIKNVLDRSACPSTLPYFKIKNGETYHPKRYKNDYVLSVHFYGKISEAEKETARKLIKKIAKNQKATVCFYNTFEEVKRV